MCALIIHVCAPGDLQTTIGRTYDTDADMHNLGPDYGTRARTEQTLALVLHPSPQMCRVNLPPP